MCAIYNFVMAWQTLWVTAIAAAIALYQWELSILIRTLELIQIDKKDFSQVSPDLLARKLSDLPTFFAKIIVVKAVYRTYGKVVWKEWSEAFVRAHTESKANRKMLKRNSFIQ